MAEPEPYEQQPGETRPAYSAFCSYRDVMPGEGRSLRRVAQQLGKSGSLISRWSSVWLWPSRAAAWDKVIEDEARQTKQAAAVAALLDYQSRMGERARALHIISGGLTRIAAVDIERRVKEPEPLSGSELASITRAVAALSGEGAALEAMALSIPQLVALYHETADA